MKVLDPQSALLTTAEVHQFLAANKPRKPDKKVGNYASVNVHNYNLVSRDLDTYIRSAAPYVDKQVNVENWMKGLIQQLKKYDLSKTEVFSLINLGIGLHDAPTAATENANGDDEVLTKNGEGEDVNEVDDDEPDREQSESNLSRMLFGLVVEEAGIRFAGDEGEERINEILKILRSVSANPTTTSDESNE